LLVEDHMSTRALKNREMTPVAAKTPSENTPGRLGRIPGMKTVERRLATLGAARMPWLRRDVDLTPPDGGTEVFGPAVPSDLGEQSRPAGGGDRRSVRTAALQTVPLTKDGIATLRNNKPVVYTIVTHAGRTVYAGVAARGHVQERLREHLPYGTDPVPGSQVRIRQVDSIATARQQERVIIDRSKPKYNVGGIRVGRD